MTAPDNIEGVEPLIPLTRAARSFAHGYPWLLNMCARKVFAHHKVGRNYYMTPSQIRAAQQTYAVESTANSVEPQHRPNTRGPHRYDHLKRR